MYDGQECAEIRHTAARSLDTEKVGHGSFFFPSVQYRIATICGIAASETYIFIYASICIAANMITQILRRKQMLQRVPSPFSIRSRHNLHTSGSSSSSSSGTGARVRQGLGSRGNVRIYRTQVISGYAASSIVLTVSLSPLSIKIAVLRALSDLTR